MINAGRCGRYHDLAALDFLEGGAAGISLFDGTPYALPPRARPGRTPSAGQPGVPAHVRCTVPRDRGRGRGAACRRARARGSRTGARASTTSRGTWHGVLTPFVGARAVRGRGPGRRDREQPAGVPVRGAVARGGCRGVATRSWQAGVLAGARTTIRTPPPIAVRHREPLLESLRPSSSSKQPQASVHVHSPRPSCTDSSQCGEVGERKILCRPDPAHRQGLRRPEPRAPRVPSPSRPPSRRRRARRCSPRTGAISSASARANAVTAALRRVHHPMPRFSTA